MIEDKMQILEEDIVIPEVVQKKAEAAFRIVHAEAKRGGNQGMKRVERSTGRENRKLKTRIKLTLLLAAVLVLAFGTVGFAYYVTWSRGLENELHATEEIKIYAEEIELVDFPEQSVTDNGITVTAKQSIVDNYFAYLSFTVSGLELTDKEEPAFEYIDASVDAGMNNVNYNAGFYSGIITGENGKPVYEDGSPMQTDADGNTIFRYKDKDGTLEYHMTLFAHEEGFFLDRPVRVSFKNLGLYTKTGEFVNKAEGEWTFDLTLQGSSESYKAQCNAALGDTGVTVTGMEISPISIKAIYDAPRQTYEEQAVDAETGEAFMHEFYVEPPALTGVKMKDGTLYPYLFMGGGSYGYTSEDSNQYVYMFAIDRILDVNQVEAFLFLKPEVEERTGTEDDFYVVEIE